MKSSTKTSEFHIKTIDIKLKRNDNHINITDMQIKRVDKQMSCQNGMTFKPMQFKCFQTVFIGNM